MIYPGAVAIGLLIMGLGQSFVAGPGQWHNYQIDREGNAVRTTLIMNGGDRHWTVTDPAGNPLPQYQNIDLDDPANANLFVHFTARLYDASEIRWPMNAVIGLSYLTPTQGIVRLSQIAPPGVRTQFRACYNAQRQLIELYDPTTRELLGTVGPNGFAKADAQPPRPFPGKLLSLPTQSGRRAMPFASMVYWLELDQRRVRPIFKASDDDPVVSADTVGPPQRPLIIVATRRHLNLVRPNGQVVFAAPYNMDAQREVLQAALLTNDHLIVEVGAAPGFEIETRLLEYAPDGSLLRSATLPTLRQPPGQKLYETTVFGTVFPPAAWPLVPKWAMDDVIDLRTQAFPTAFAVSMLMSSLLAGMILAVLGWRYAIGWRRTGGWTLAGLLFGLPSLAAFLGLHEKPAAEKCRHCGARRLADRRRCPRCKAPLPPPALDGSEIFEPHAGAEVMAMS